MNAVLPLHLTLAGLWVGCVLTEVFFERALLGHGHEQERVLAQLHRKVDLWIELPALIGVFLTGGTMLHRAQRDPWLMGKVACGLLAVLANLYCVYLVLQRARCAQAGQWKAFERIDHAQHRWGAVVLIALLLSLLQGLIRVS
ncbi:MAG: hypothetical protein FWG56_07705 [Desulfovibrionaceae bacterium]|nr:hypothetical protein [Desulfovibrionaceae bacterium]